MLHTIEYLSMAKIIIVLDKSAMGVYNLIGKLTAVQVANLLGFK